MGGPQSRFVRMLAGMGALHHHVVAMDDRWGAMPAAQAAGAVSALRIPLSRRGPIANVAALRGAIAATAPALVVGYNWGAIEAAIAARLSDAPHLQVEDGFGPEEAHRRLRRRSVARRILLGWARSRMLVCSHGLERIALDEWWMPRGRVLRIPNGVDAERIAGRATRRGRSRFATTDHDVIVGTVAGLRPEKNLAALVRAMAGVAQVRLVIAGDGPQRPAIERIARDAGVASRLVLLGHVPDPMALYREFDVFGSSSATEQLPMALLEAMAAGLPAAAFDVGDIAGTVAEPNLPFVVTAGDERALRAALETLAASADLRQRIGDANRERARRHYSLESTTDAWLALFEAIAGFELRAR